jgi:superfamily I DNA and RNA helicase
MPALIARAKLLATADSGRKLLVLCFNRSLCAYLKAQFGEDPSYRNVEVNYYHAWAERLTGLSKRSDESFETYNRHLTDVAFQKARGLPEETKYDPILIDEAHDFEPGWFLGCTSALKTHPPGDLLIAVDGAQSLYGRPKSFTWRSVGVQAQGRSRRLSVNYRNTKEIIEFTWRVTQAAAPEEDGCETHVRVRPKAVLKRGPVPTHRPCATFPEEVQAVAELAAHFRAAGVPSERIGILYLRDERGRVRQLYDSLAGRGVGVCWVTTKDDDTARDQFITRPGVRLCTVHSAKGLEFQAVIFSGVDQLPNPYQGDPAADNNLFYVGLTRATERLVLTWTGQSEFTERVERCPFARRWPG